MCNAGVLSICGGLPWRAVMGGGMFSDAESYHKKCGPVLFSINGGLS